ncbi:MAG: caspase family protein [Clostridia bacterium]
MLARRVRVLGLVLALLLLFQPIGPIARAEDSLSEDDARALLNTHARVERALLIGVDEFVSKPSTYPSSTNNVYAMQEAFQAALTQLRTLLLPDRPVTSAEELTRLIRKTFAKAQEGDVSYLYLSTHGEYDPQSGKEPLLLLSDGVTEGSISPAQLEAAFDGIEGTKVMILDACNSGAFIGKGLSDPPEKAYFLGDDFKVLTSSGALEESWYWSADDTIDTELKDQAPQGTYYFTQALADSLSPRSGYPADRNRDGSVTLSELYDYLLLNHAASTPQVYPQTDSFVVFRYATSDPLPTGLNRSPITDVTFSGTTLSRDSRDITIEFIAMRPVRVAYQVVYQREGKWEFDKAQLIYDAAERYTTYGDRAGAISAGRKVRTLTIGALTNEAYGYVLVQLVSIDQGKLTVHAGRAICVPPESGELNLSTRTQAVFPSDGRELTIFVGHDYPCELSVAIVDGQDKVVHRLCHRESTRPMQIKPTGSVFYWNGRLKSGEKAAPGVYRVRAQAKMNDATVTVFSDHFTLQ